MQNLGIDVLPHITNALLVTSIFSAGNTYVYASTRTLYGLALEGQAPKFLRKCTKKGVLIGSRPHAALLTILDKVSPFTASWRAACFLCCLYFRLEATPLKALPGMIA